MDNSSMRGDHHELQAVWFAAGTAAFIACIERAVVVSLFTHWHVWAFLALNLLLLAILFTSSRPQIQSKIQIDSREDEDDASQLINGKSTISEDQCRPLISNTRKAKQLCEIGVVESEKKLAEIDNTISTGETDEKREGHDYQLSKEELNQRVEAFIAMFRKQYLVSDVKGKSFNNSTTTHRRLSFSHRNEYEPGRLNSGRRVSFSYNNEYIST